MFNAEQEQGLAIYLRKCINHYYGLSIIEMRELAYQYAVKVNVKMPKVWTDFRMASKQWYYGFMLRHKEFSLRSPEQTSLNRVRAFCRENVDTFFQLLDTIIHEYGESDEWNMDETGFSTVPSTMGKVISLKGLKRVGSITSAERGSMMTLAFAVSATGNTIPPFYLFPRKNMSTSYREHVTRETVTIANESGWMTQNEFLLWMRHFIQYSGASKSRPKLLFLDNHSSHLSVETIDLAVENGVTMITFPPHCSHRMQPLDVSVYGPVKNAYKRAHSRWMKNNAGTPMQIMHIPLLIKEALTIGATKDNIEAGFKATGICPFNDAIFKETDFISAEAKKDKNKLIYHESQFSEEEQRRIVIVDEGEDMNLAATETASFIDESTDTSLAIGEADAASETVSLTRQSTPTDEARASTSHEANERRSASEARISNYVQILDEIGPVQNAPQRKKSNRGPKPGKTTILTSPENVTQLREKQQKRKDALEAKAAKKKQKLDKNVKPIKSPAAKSSAPKASTAKSPRTKPSARTTPAKGKKKHDSSSSELESSEECDGCHEKFTQKATPRNSYMCMGQNCYKLIHIGCAELKYSVWTCKDCDSDDDLE